MLDVIQHSDDVVELVYKDVSSNLGNELVLPNCEPDLEIVTTGQPWSFNSGANVLIFSIVLVCCSRSAAPSTTCHRFVNKLKGETGAVPLLVQSSNLGKVARDLAYCLYSLCDRKGWTQEATAYNSLVISWSEIARLALEKSAAPAQPVQGSFEF